MIFVDECVLKEENKEVESGDQMKKIAEYHLLNQNARWMYGEGFV